jgi:surface antigen
LAFTQTSQTQQTRSRSKHLLRRGLVTLGAVAALSLFGMATSTGTAQAATSLHYRYGLYLEHGWLCRGWSNGAYHCTQHWHVDRAGNLISDNQAWVPTGRGAGSTARGTRSTASRRSGGTTHHGSSAHSPTPRGISQWAYTGHPAYAMRDYRGDPNAAWFGQCTWYAQYRRLDQRLMGLGNAWQWAWNARARGLRTGTAPAVGATVVFQPGVQGASRLGHVGHVEAVYGNGWFLVSTMNTYWNGGGWGRVSYVYAHTGNGVSFIY